MRNDDFDAEEFDAMMDADAAACAAAEAREERSGAAMKAEAMEEARRMLQSRRRSAWRSR